MSPFCLLFIPFTSPHIGTHYWICHTFYAIPDTDPISHPYSIIPVFGGYDGSYLFYESYMVSIGLHCVTHFLIP